MRQGRRYKAGEIKAYDDVYNLRRVRSTVLNTGNRTIWNMHETSDLTGLKNTLHMYIGDDAGEIKGKNPPEFAQIPALMQELKQCEAKFRQVQNQRLKNGQGKLSQWPKALAEQKYKFEALLDIAEAEADYLKKHIAEYEVKEQAEVDKNMLRHGLLCVAKGEPPREIDGQSTSFINDALVITDTRSPYQGMAVVDYRTMAAHWIKENSQLKNRRVKREQLPEWPQGAKKYI